MFFVFWVGFSTLYPYGLDIVVVHLLVVIQNHLLYINRLLVFWNGTLTTLIMAEYGELRTVNPIFESIRDIKEDVMPLTTYSGIPQNHPYNKYTNIIP